MRADVAIRDIARASAHAVGRRLASRGVDVVSRRDGTRIEDTNARVDAIEARFFDLQAERAAAEATELVEALERGEHGIVATTLLVRVLLVLAQAAAAVGDGPASDAAIDRLLVIDPDLVLDPARHSPVLRTRVDARRTARDTARVTLRIDAAPPDARVHVDGRAHDVQHLPDVHVGRHIIQVEAPGFSPCTTAITVTPGHQGAIECAPIRTPDALDAIAGPPESPLTREARDALEVEGWYAVVLDARVEDGRARYRLWRADGEDIRVEADAATPGERVAERLYEVEQARVFDAAQAERARRRRRVIGVVVGSVALAGGAVTTGVMLRPRPPTGWQPDGTIEDGE